jgi:hypothetical protein
MELFCSRRQARTNGIVGTLRLQMSDWPEMRFRMLVPIGAAILAGLAVTTFFPSSLEDSLPGHVVVDDSKLAVASHSVNPGAPGPVRDVVQATAESSKIDPEIDWERVQSDYPIPRQLPVGLSGTPAGAGFVKQWVERALGEKPSVVVQYRDLPLINPVSLILDVISEPKDVEDNWPFGVEFELQTTLALEFSGPRAVVLTRLFCNGHGCLVYLEHEATQNPNLKALSRRINGSPVFREFGISSDSLFEIYGGATGLDVRWRMLLIDRRP